MNLLFGSKKMPQSPGERTEPTLVATFDTEEQLKAYVQWATLRKLSEGAHDFEQGSALAGYRYWYSEERADEVALVEVPSMDEVVHNPSPNML